MLPIHYLLFIPPTLLFGYYLGRKIKNSFKIKRTILFWILYWTIILGSVLTLSFPTIVFAYTVALFLLYDFLRWVAKKMRNKKFSLFLDKAYLGGLPLFFIALLFTAYGMYSARNPIIQSYKVEVDKKMKSSLTIVLLSDLHLGTGTNENTVDTIIKMVNKQKADIFLIAGDLYDERTSNTLKNYAFENLGKAKTKYGTYYVEGNHDLLTGTVRSKMRLNDIIPLEDEKILIDQSFYLIGRKDKKHKRATLQELITDIDHKYPIILLDHRPEEENLALREGIDLQLAGHTHAGQIFPGNFFLKYGYFKKEDFHLIVSTGYGNWGIPVRTYTKNELVKIKVTEKKQT